MTFNQQIGAKVTCPHCTNGRDAERLCRLIPGRGFPDEPAVETTSQNLRPKRVAVSQTTPFRKPHPTIPANSGMQLPLWALRGNSSPEFALETGSSFLHNRKSPRWQQMSPARAWRAFKKARYRDPHQLWNAEQHRCAMPAGLPSNEARRSLRQSAQCRQSADTAR